MLVRLQHDADRPATVTCDGCCGTAEIDATSPLVTQMAAFITGHLCWHVIVLPDPTGG